MWIGKAAHYLVKEIALCEFLNNRKRYWKPREKAKLQMNYYNAFMIEIAHIV